ncbi:MAG: hypothetical protein LKI53_07695 [Bacteroidales bacterium]|nr:hypothetical protein [Bacteroidales bacterium]
MRKPLTKILSGAVFSCALLLSAISASGNTGICNNFKKPVKQTDSCITSKESSKYYYNLHKYHTVWQKLIPRHYKLQFAGSIGLISFGPGWGYGKKEQWETNFMVGYTPKYSSATEFVTLNLKETYMPWRMHIKNTNLDYIPLTVAFTASSTTSGKLWVHEPGRYPNNYYKFYSKVRGIISIGQRIKFDIPGHMRRYNKYVSFYYELNSCDLYIVSKVGNEQLGFWDVVNLSFGIKYSLF